MVDRRAIRQRWESVGSKLDERGRRVFAAGEVRAAGWGGLEAVSAITGLARSTIGRGLKDLDAAPGFLGGFHTERAPSHPIACQCAPCCQRDRGSIFAGAFWDPKGCAGPVGRTRHSEARARRPRSCLRPRHPGSQKHPQVVLDVVNLTRWSFCFEGRPHLADGRRHYQR